VIFFLWISLGTFVAPAVVSAWYLVITKELAEFAKYYKSFQCLRKLQVQADFLTAKLRLAKDGVQAIFNDEGSKDNLYNEIMDYVMDLLFFKGHSLQRMTLEQMAKTMHEANDIYRPVILKSRTGEPMDLEPKDRVKVYLPRTNKSDLRYATIKTVVRIKTVITQVLQRENTYYAEEFGKVPLEVMSEEDIKNHLPDKAVIIGEKTLSEAEQKEVTYEKDDPVDVYMPLIEMNGTVTYRNDTGLYKQYDVLYDYDGSKKKTRFYAEALKFWKKIPADFEYKNFFAYQKADSPGASTESQTTESEDIEPKWAEFGKDVEEANKVREALEGKGIALGDLGKALSKHGVGEIPLYAWQVFHDGQDPLEYMAELVENKLPPLNVVAAYRDVQAKIAAVANTQLEQQLNVAVANKDLKATNELLAKLGNPQGKLDKFLYDMFIGKEDGNLDVVELGNLLGAISNPGLVDDEVAVEKYAEQFEERKQSFRQWMGTFNLLVDGESEYGQLDDWANMLKAMEGEQKARHKKRLDKVASVKDHLIDSLPHGLNTVGPAGEAKENVQESVKEVIRALVAPINLSAAFYQRIFAFLSSIFLSLFSLLGYKIFGSEGASPEFTLAVFVGVQATIFGLYYDDTSPEQFEKDSLQAARAYHVDRFRTQYDESFQSGGRLCCERYKCCLALGFGAPPAQHSTAYHRWRAMAIHKMIQDRK